jgi:hypothetical protein
MLDLFSVPRASVGFLFGLFSDPEDEDIPPKFLPPSPNYIALKPRGHTLNF